MLSSSSKISYPTGPFSHRGTKVMGPSFHFSTRPEAYSSTNQLGSEPKLCAFVTGPKVQFDINKPKYVIIIIHFYFLISVNNNDVTLIDITRQ